MSEVFITNFIMEFIIKANITSEGFITVFIIVLIIAVLISMSSKFIYKVMAGGKTCFIMEGSFRMMVIINKTVRCYFCKEDFFIFFLE